MTSKQARSKNQEYAFYTLNFNAFFRQSNKMQCVPWYIPTLDTHSLLLCINLKDGHTYSWMDAGGFCYVVYHHKAEFYSFPSLLHFYRDWLLPMTNATYLNQ